MNVEDGTLDIGLLDSHSFSEKALDTIPDSSVDIVMSAFGLYHFQDPNAAIKSIHRILKPGGSFIATTWDSIALESIANRIMSKVIGEGHTTPYGFLNFDNFSQPRALEELMHWGGLGVIQSEHYEFPFVLAEDGILNERAFDMAILPVRHILEKLEESGMHPNAMSEARQAFDEMVEQGDLVSVDKHGCLITAPNRFNLAIGRRLHEDSDGLLRME